MAGYAIRSSLKIYRKQKMLPNEKASLEDEYSYEYFIRRDACSFSQVTLFLIQHCINHYLPFFLINLVDKLCRSSKQRVRSEELSEYLKQNPIQVLEIG